MRTSLRPRPGRRAISFRPRLEALEDRRLLACSVTASASGTLTIGGDNAANTVLITDNGSDAPGNVTVTCDGTAMTPAVAVHAIRISTRGGNDVVGYTLTGPLSGSSRSVRVDLGTGDDSWTANLAGGLVNGSSWGATVSGSTGNDMLQALVSGGVSGGSAVAFNYSGGTGNDRLTGQVGTNLADGSSLVFGASGSTGNDTIAEAFSGQLLGGSQALFSASGGTGNDAIQGTFGGDVFDGSLLRFSADGGVGNDLVALATSGNLNLHGGSSMQANLYGGDGTDQVFTNYQGSVNGALSVRGDGGANNDRVATVIKLMPDGNAPGSVRARVVGSSGNDRLTLVARPLPGDPALDVNALIQGGSGGDVGRHSANVGVMGCERQALA
jgi:hypothetical protein